MVALARAIAAVLDALQTARPPAAGPSMFRAMGRPIYGEDDELGLD